MFFFKTISILFIRHHGVVLASHRMLHLFIYGSSDVYSEYHLLLRGLWILYALPLDNICVADKVNNLTGVRLITLQP